MIWHYIVTITAATMITLPFPVNSAHCDEKTWNRYLKLQQEVDFNYNVHAHRFNQLLQVYQTRPLLSKEFSQQEIATLWQSNNAIHSERMDAQLAASKTLLGHIQQESKAIEPLTSKVSDLQSKWIEISKHCASSEHKVNMITSLNYAQLSQALIVDIRTLLRQLAVIESGYIQEIEALVNTKPTPQED